MGHQCVLSLLNVSNSLRPLDCSPPGFSMARILEWAAISSSRGSSRPGIGVSWDSYVAGVFFITEPRESPQWVPKSLHFKANTWLMWAQP